MIDSPFVPFHIFLFSNIWMLNRPPPPITIIYTTYLLTSWPPFLFPGTMLRRTFLSLSQETSAIYKETFYHVNPSLCVTYKCISISCVLFTLAPTFIGNFSVVFYGENIQWLSDFVPLYANNALIGILPPWLCLNIVGSSTIYGCGITLLRPTGLFCFFSIDSWGVAQSAADVSVCVWEPTLIDPTYAGE